MDHSSKKANTFLQYETPELKSLFEKVKFLEELNKKVSRYLDINTLKYCQVANLIGNKLIFIVANGSIATQLRFQSLELLRKFKQDPALHMIHTIDCKVRPVMSVPNSRLQNQTVKSMAPLSECTAEIIREIAETLDDKKLKDVMLRIAGRTK